MGCWRDFLSLRAKPLGSDHKICPPFRKDPPLAAVTTAVQELLRLAQSYPAVNGCCLLFRLGPILVSG